MSRETKMEILELLKDGFKNLGLSISDEKILKFNKYLYLIKSWNDRINLTSIDDDKQIVLKHFFDSIIPVKMYDLNDKNIVDIGTGAGLPSIPIKILNDDIKLTLVDSSKKKILAVKNMCDELGLKNILFVSDNIEIIGKNSEFRKKYDYALIRAFGNISTIIECAIPLLKINGKAILYKGPNVDKEVENSEKAQEELNAKIVKKQEFIIPFSDYKRYIIVVEKIGETKEKYPRRVGIPKNRHL